MKELLACRNDQISELSKQLQEQESTISTLHESHLDKKRSKNHYESSESDRDRSCSPNVNISTLLSALKV